MSSVSIPGAHLIDRLSDAIFGYDFFISYHHGDGGTYPAEVEAALRRKGFRVFLDRIGYAPGDELGLATRRRVRMSSYLIVVARPGAMTKSDWVVREVDVCIEAGRTPIVVDVDGAFHGTAPQGLDERARLTRLHGTLGERLRIKEVGGSAPGVAYDGSPSNDVIDGLVRSFEGRRQESRRSRALATATMTFAVVGAVAIYFAVVARQQTARAEAQAARAKAETVRAEAQTALADEQRNIAEGERQIADERRSVAEAQQRRDDLRRPAPQGTLPDRLISEEDDTNGLLVALDGLAFPASGDVVHASDAIVSTIERALAANFEGKILAGHSGGVTVVRFTPDGGALLSGSVDGTVRLWTREGKQNGVIRAHGLRVDDLALSGDGKELATIAGRAIKVWSLPERKLKAELNVSVEKKPDDGDEEDDDVWSSIDLSADGRWALSASQGHRATLWDIVSRREAGHFSAGPDVVPWASLSPDGETVALPLGNLEQVAFWRTTGTPIRSTGKESEEIIKVAWSPDGKRFATACRDGTASVWNVSSGARLSKLEGHLGSIQGIAFSPDGLSIATGSHDRTVRLWYARSGVERALFRGHAGEVTDVAFSPDGRFVASGSTDRTVRLWAVPDDGAKTPGATIESVDVSWFDVDRRGGRVAVGYADGTLSVSQFHPAKAALRRVRVSSAGVRLTRFLGDGSKLLAAADDGEAQLWDLRTGKRSVLGKKGDDPWRNVAAAADGRSFIVFDDMGRTTTWQTEPLLRTGREEHQEFSAFDGFVGPRGILLLIREIEDDFAFVTKPGKPNAPLFEIPPPNEQNEHDRIASRSAFSPSGALLAVASPVKFTMWDVAARKLLFTVPRTQAKTVVESSFSRDGGRLLTTYEDFIADVREARTGRVRCVLTGHQGPIIDQELNDVGSEALTVSEDGSWRLWDVASGRPLRVVHAEDVIAARFVPGRPELLLVLADGSFRLVPRYVSLASVRKAVHRCLTPLERKAFALPARPPRWCITGIGREASSDPATWAGLWPYESHDWKLWLQRGSKGPMPLADGEDEEPE